MRNAIVPLLAVVVMVAIASGSMFLANSNILAAQAAPVEPAATATPEPVEECPEWRNAGDQIIYKCDDPDAMVTCYQPAGGVLQCVPWQ